MLYVWTKNYPQVVGTCSGHHGQLISQNCVLTKIRAEPPLNFGNSKFGQLASISKNRLPARFSLVQFSIIFSSSLKYNLFCPLGALYVCYSRGDFFEPIIAVTNNN